MLCIFRLPGTVWGLCLSAEPDGIRNAATDASKRAACAPPRRPVSPLIAAAILAVCILVAVDTIRSWRKPCRERSASPIAVCARPENDSQ